MKVVQDVLRSQGQGERHVKVVQDVLRSQGQGEIYVKVVPDASRGDKVKVRDMRRLFKMF